MVQIGVVDYIDGSPLLVTPDKGREHAPYKPEEDSKKLVKIEDAKNGDYFLWENWSYKIFPGFYETMIGGTTWLEDIIESDSYEIDDLYSDGEEPPEYLIKSWEDFEERFENKVPGFWRTYENHVSEKYSEVLWERVKKAKMDHIILSMKYDHLWSPSYYNFQTDKLNLRLSANFDNLEDFIRENEEDFRNYLEENWSSYDGFFSFVPNTLEKLRESHYYRTICIEYLMLKVVGEDSESSRYDDYYDSIEYEILEWLSELSVYDIVSLAEEKNSLQEAE